MTIKSTLTDGDLVKAMYEEDMHNYPLDVCRRVADDAATKERSRCADYLLSLVTLYGDDLNILDVVDAWEHWRI